MIRRHFFLIGAVALILLMGVFAGVKLLAPKEKSGPGAPGAAAAQGRGGGGAPGRGAGRGGAGRGGASVAAATIGMRTFADRLEVLGVAKGRESVTLTSNTTEMVTAVRFRDGQRVQRGQILVELKTNEEDANILQAQSAAGIAKLESDRWTALADRGVAPRATAEQYQGAYRQAQANLQAAESRRGDRVIRAPFSGVVGLSDVAPGALITPGTAIATLDDISVVRVDFDVPDRFLSGLRPGAPLSAQSDAYPDRLYRGVIAQIDTRIDERTRSIKARAEFRNVDSQLKPGMLMRVAIDRGSRQALAAPEAAVQFSAQQPFVYVLAQRGPQTIAQQRAVVTGVIEQGFVEIREGLKAGDRIVADGLNKVQPNQPVSVGGAPGAPGPRGAGRPGPAAK